VKYDEKHVKNPISVKCVKTS